MPGLQGKDKIIFIPTVHHTGTWFCLRFLYQHSKVCYIQTGNVTNLTDIDIVCEGKVLFHTHMMGWQGDGLYGYGLGKDRNKIPIKWNEVLEFSKAYYTISTIRDPLASIITRQKRHPGFSHQFIVDGFVELVKLSYQGLFIIPVDLYSKKSQKERYTLLCKVLELVDLPEEEYVKLWAKDWPVRNSIPGLGGTALHESYALGDIAPIIQDIPDDYAYLKSKSRILKPFLQKLGYENLLWWD